MSPGKELFYVSFAVLCVSCLANIVMVQRIRNHIRGHHPDIWRSFGWRNASRFTFTRKEGEDEEAAAAFSAFLRSKRPLELQDETLERLVRMRYRLFWVAGPAFVTTGVLLFLFKP
jgi:hypothetical protein